MDTILKFFYTYFNLQSVDYKYVFKYSLLIGLVLGFLLGFKKFLSY